MDDQNATSSRWRLRRRTHAGGPARRSPNRRRGAHDDRSGIVVTAQRREQSSQDVGVALSVIGGQDLDEKGVQVINDIENVVPNLEVDSQFGSGQPAFRIRGIGTREYSSNNASTVGVYVDEVAHPYTITTQGAMFDIARIEVLRGPQGTLYGRNTTGGAINIITNAPTQDTRAGLNAEYGSYDRYKVEAYVSGQIAPGLLGRLAAVTEQGGAWQYNRETGEKLGDRDKTALRGRLIGVARLVLTLPFLITRSAWTSTITHVTHDWLLFGTVLLLAQRTNFLGG